MNSIKHSKDNKRKDTELTEEQSTEKQTEKRARLSNANGTIEVPKKSIEKILSQNAQIDSKLEKLIAGQKRLEQRITNLEKSVNNNKNTNIDPKYIRKHIKQIARKLFENSIYPTQSELREATNSYLKDEDPEFLKKFNKNQWTLYYEKEIYQDLLSQHRSIRGTFTSKVKEAIFVIFGNELPQIKSEISVQEWKVRPEVRQCYKKLFKKFSEDQPSTYMTKIIEKVWKEKKNAPKIQIAFAISICEVYLNPDNQVIQISEQVMDSKIRKNLTKFVNKDKFSCSDEEESESSVIPTDVPTTDVNDGEIGDETEEDDEPNNKKNKETNDEAEEYAGSTDEELKEMMQDNKEKYKKKINY